MGAILLTRICTHRCDHAFYALKSRIMPTRICSHKRLVYVHIGKHARMYMQKTAQSFHTYMHAYISAIMPARVCTHRRDRAFTYMNT